MKTLTEFHLLTGCEGVRRVTKTVYPFEQNWPQRNITQYLHIQGNSKGCSFLLGEILYTSFSNWFAWELTNIEKVRSVRKVLSSGKQLLGTDLYSINYWDARDPWPAIPLLSQYIPSSTASLRWRTRCPSLHNRKYVKLSNTNGESYWHQKPTLLCNGVENIHFPMV